MSCPSHQEIVLAVAGKGASAEIRHHARDCGACRTVIEEQDRMAALFKAHCTPVEPPPFLWNRIEARLQRPASAPVSRWSRFFQPARLYPVAAILVLALVASAVVFRIGWGPSEADILANMEQSYQKTMFPLGEENPFDGQGILESLPDENPFGQTAQTGPLPGTADGNPFSEAIARGL